MVDSCADNCGGTTVDKASHGTARGNDVSTTIDTDKTRGASSVATFSKVVSIEKDCTRGVDMEDDVGVASVVVAVEGITPKDDSDDGVENDSIV